MSGNKLINELTEEEKRKRREYHRGYRENNKEKANARQRAYRLENKKEGDDRYTHRLYKHPLYKYWNNMTQRVRGNKYYKDINVCVDWLQFLPFYNWAVDNGYNKGLTLDRINNKGDYEPTNCRWITQKEQMSNTRNNRVIFYRGEYKNIAQWCEELELNRNTVVKRLNSGIPPEMAFLKGKIIKLCQYLKKNNIPYKTIKSTDLEKIIDYATRELEHLRKL